MHRGAQVVNETRERELGGSGAPAERRLCFVNHDAMARLGEHDGRRKTIGPGSNYDSIDGIAHVNYSSLSSNCCNREAEWGLRAITCPGSSSSDRWRSSISSPFSSQPTSSSRSSETKAFSRYPGSFGT